MSSPSVGQAVRANEAVGGLKDTESRPTVWKTAPKLDAGMLSMLTISKDSTGSKVNIPLPDGKRDQRTFIWVGIKPGFDCEQY